MVEWLASNYDWLRAFHLMSVIAWMAGIFYLPRLFVYHAERAPAGSELSETFKVMERRLFRAIMTPAMISTWIFGLLMLIVLGWETIAAQHWLQIKLALVVAMSAFHDRLGAWTKDFAADRNVRSGRFYRLANELPTLLMAVIVIMAVVEPF